MQGDLRWVNGDPISFQEWKNTYFMNNFSAADNFTFLSPLDEFINPDLNVKLKLRGQNILFPEQNKSVCGALSLFNLADPEWITVGCDEPLTEHNFCI